MIDQQSKWITRSEIGQERRKGGGFEMTRYFSLLTLPESRLNDLVSYRRLCTSLWLNPRCPWCGMLTGSGGKDSFKFIRNSFAERSPFVNLSTVTQNAVIETLR